MYKLPLRVMSGISSGENFIAASLNFLYSGVIKFDANVDRLDAMNQNNMN